ncbi:MAG TPA: DUF1295 domain-containing protein [Caulobacteraceae bacterium]
MIGLIVIVTVGLCLAMAGAWVIQRRLGNAGWADVVWAFATGTAGMAYALTPTGDWRPGPRAWLAAGMAAAWSAPLGWRLALRTAAARSEDARYGAFRLEWGAAFEPKLFVFLQAQALVSAVLALSMLIAARNPAPGLRASDFAAAAILAIAVAGEGLADSQLRIFKTWPANAKAICDVGLWSWSRHPNYFFEWIGWFAWPLLAIDPFGRWPLGWIAFIAPTLMFVLLRFVSGVPPTEAAMARSRGAAFAAYQARVSAFFLLPPRSTSAAA